jgi:hypothetical protein
MVARLADVEPQHRGEPHRLVDDAVEEGEPLQLLVGRIAVGRDRGELFVQLLGSARTGRI